MTVLINYINDYKNYLQLFAGKQISLSMFQIYHLILKRYIINKTRFINMTYLTLILGLLII